MRFSKAAIIFLLSIATVGSSVMAFAPQAFRSSSPQSGRGGGGGGTTIWDTSLLVTTDTTTQTKIEPSPTTLSLPEMGRDGIYHIRNKDQHRAFLQANPDKLVVFKFFAPWCKACKGLEPKFQMIANDKKYKQFPLVFADLSVVDNKDYIKSLGVMALPSVQFYAGKEGLVENFPCGPSKVPILKRKLAQLIKERIDPATYQLKKVQQSDNPEEESVPCAERSIMEETAEQETEFTVAGVKVSKEQMDYLRNGVPFFADFSDDEFFGLMKKARLLSFDAGSIIVREGKRARTFYVIESGEVEVCAHTSFEDILTTPPTYPGAVINRLSKQEYFGERALITGERRAASIRASEKTRCFAFDKDDVPSSSILSGLVSPSEARLREVDKKYGVDVHGLDLLEISRQLEDSKLGSQIRGSVNTPKPIKGVDYDSDSSDDSTKKRSSSSPFGVENDVIIPLLVRFKLVRLATRCFEYIVNARPKWGDAGILRRRSLLVSMLTHAQREEFRELFTLIDTSGDNKISLLELRKVMESIGEEKSDEELRVMVNAEDVITYDDFMGIMAEAEFYHLFRDTFKSLDTTDTGFVKASDLERVLCGMQDLTSDKSELLMKVEDKDMMIDYEQFSKMLLGTTKV